MSSKESGFTLVELLIVVLIIGILATIAIPVFNGQRTKARNSSAQSSVRIALSAATVLAVNDQDSFAGITSAEVAVEDKSLLPGTGTIDPPGTGAEPRRAWVYRVTSTGAADTTVQSGDDNGIVVCTVSKGDKIFCIRSLRKTVGSVSAGTTFASGATLAAATTGWGASW